MYSKIISCLFAVFYVVQSFSQGYTIIDYQNSKGYSDILELDYERNYGIKVININKSLFDFDNKQGSTNFATTIPPIFQTEPKINTDQPEPEQAADDGSQEEMVATGYSANLSIDSLRLDDIRDIDNLRYRAKIIYESISSYEKLNSELRDTLITIKESFDIITGFNLLDFEIDRLSKNCLMTYEEIDSSLVNRITEFYLTSEREYLDNNNYISDDGKLSKDDFYKVFKSLILYYKFKFERSNRYADKILSEPNYPLKIEQINKLDTLIDSFLNDLNKYKTNYSEEEKKIVTDLNSKGESQYLLINFDKNKKYYSYLSTDSIASYFTELNGEGLKTLTNRIDNINESNFTYYTSLKQAESDEHKITLSIKPKDDVPCDATPANYMLKIKTKGGIKIDFSTGIVFNINWNGYENSTYRSESITDTTATIVKNDNRNVAFPAVGGFVHIHPRTANNSNWAATFGLSSTDLSSFNGHLGFSYYIGREQRVIGTIGGTFGQISLLSSQFNEDEIYKKDEIPTEIPTTNTFRLGGFIGISYNL